MKMKFLLFYLFVPIYIIGQTYTSYHPEETFKYLEYDSHTEILINGLIKNGFLNDNTFEELFDNNFRGLRNYLNTKTFSFWDEGNFYMISYNSFIDDDDQHKNIQRPLFLYRLTKNNTWVICSDTLHMFYLSYPQNIRNSYYGSKTKKDKNRETLVGYIIKNNDIVKINLICFISDAPVMDKPKYYYLSLYIKKKNGKYNLVNKEINYTIQ